MRFLTLITLLFLQSIALLSQNKISNTLDADYKLIEGTKVSLVPPKDFSKAMNFAGLENIETNSSIMVTEIPGPFSEITKGFTAEGFKSKGIEVISTEQILLNESPALFISTKQEVAGVTYNKYILCLDAGKETIMVNGSTLNDNKASLKRAIKNALLSLIYDAKNQINPWDNVDYTVKSDSSKLYLTKNISNAFVFSVDGNLPTKSFDKTTLIISKSFSKVSITDKKQFTTDRLRQLTVGESPKIEQVKAISIDSLDGYEIVATVTKVKTGETEKIYETILFNGDSYYIFWGSTNQNFDKNIQRLRKVVKTFKRK